MSTTTNAPEENETIVCVCVPVYNSRNTIKETLESILNQTYDDYKVIVVDNASTDGTYEILKKFKDPRLKIYRNEKNIGGESNWNKCLELSDGRYTALFHSDDVYNPTILEKEMSVIKENPEVGGVFTIGYLINDIGEIRGRFDIPSSLRGKRVISYLELLPAIVDSPLRNNNPFITPTAVVRTDIYRKLIPFRIVYKSAADLDLWLRLAKENPVAIVEERLIKYRLSTKKGVYNLDTSRTYEEDYFRVLDTHIASKPKDLVIPAKALERYEIRRNIDRIKRSVNYLTEGNNAAARDLLSGFLSVRVLLPILRNLDQPVLLVYWLAAICMLVASYMCLGKPLSALLRWYRYHWQRKWLE